EGIVYGLYSVGKALEDLAGPIQTIHANGGFAQAPFWVQLLADVFNKRVLVSKGGAQDAAKGAYIVVRKALGELPGFEAADDESSYDTFEPDAGTHRRYMENFELFGRLYDRLKDEF